MEGVAEIGELNETAVLVFKKDVVRFDVCVNDSQFLDVKKREEELAAEGLDCDETETGSGSKLAEGVAEVQGHVGEHDAEVIAIHEGFVHGNAVLGVLRVFGLNFFQQTQLVLGILRHLLDTAKNLDGHGLVGLGVHTAKHRREDSLSILLHDAILVPKDLSNVGAVVPLLVVPVVLQVDVLDVLCIFRQFLLLLNCLFALLLFLLQLFVKLVITGKHVEHIIVLGGLGVATSILRVTEIKYESHHREWI